MGEQVIGFERAKAMCRLSLMSKPAPNIAAKDCPVPRGLQLGGPTHPEMVTLLAVTPPTRTCANGVNISCLR